MASLLKLGCSGIAPALRGGAMTVAIALVCSFAPAAARAYSSPDAYFDRASQGGGGGRWFTGSPADGFGCNVCHTNTPQGRDFPLYVAGLPTGGYALASRQEIVLSWPEFATRWRELRPDPTVPDAPGVARPAVGAVLELVAESGRGSGVIEIDTLVAGGAQLCEAPKANLKPRLGVKLYQVRAGLEPLLIRPDGNGLLRCESRRLGQRCLLALNNCGAHEVRFTWTAPATWEGPIWFSAGFVASERLSGTAQEDSVQEVSVPIVQAGTPGAVYEDTLRQACGVALRRESAYASGLWTVGLLAALLVRRSGRRARE
jgi:hypothetical protein